jgi:divalent metal cation (Fe/Co/Zn/Cd) transporter
MAQMCILWSPKGLVNALFIQAGESTVTPAIEYSKDMSGFVQIGPQSAKANSLCAPVVRSRSVVWLQVITLAWMLVECGLSLYAAATAHSPALLAFGSDSLVELLSASVVLLQFGSPASISQRTAGRIASVLLYALALIVAGIALLSLLVRQQPEASCIGITVTVAALIAMPVLAALKRREAKRTGNVALAADAVQSATCAYLALVTLAGLAVNAAFQLPWFDSLAALVAIPILVYEARSAWQGHACGCC